MGYQPVIGLEIHAQLLTEHKVFCSCENGFAKEENTNCCGYCTGIPGTLPCLNRDAVALAVKAGLALGCKIQKISSFDRKNYFYPDLPKAYQITQFFHPICTDGAVRIGKRTIRIERIHIEEDAGKLLHEQSQTKTLVDLNRAAVPLIEIVTKPDISSAEEARLFVEEVAARLIYAGVCDGRMQEGSLRVDVNISVHHPGEALGVRAEIKNLNSYRSVVQAIEYEISRQTALLEKGEKVEQQTRRFDETSGTTHLLRRKAEAEDYRYFPEPDLPLIILTEKDIQNLQKEIPEMPSERLERYCTQYHLSKEDAAVLVSKREISDFYEKVISENKLYKESAVLIRMDLLKLLEKRGQKISSVDASVIAKLIKLYKGKDAWLSHSQAVSVLEKLLEGESDPIKTAEKLGFLKKQDPEAFQKAVAEVIMENPKAVKQYQDGVQKVYGFLIGQISKKLGAGFDAKLAGQYLTKQLTSHNPSTTEK